MKNLNMLLICALSAGLTINTIANFKDKIDNQPAQISQKNDIQNKTRLDALNLASFFHPTLASCKKLDALVSSNEKITRENIIAIVDAMSKTGSQEDIQFLMDREIDGTLHFAEVVRACPALKECLAEEIILQEKLSQAETNVEAEQISKKFDTQKLLCTQIMIDFTKSKEAQISNSLNSN